MRRVVEHVLLPVVAARWRGEPVRACRLRGSFSAGYTTAHWKDVGKGIVFALLEMESLNPWPRIARYSGVTVGAGVADAEFV